MSKVVSWVLGGFVMVGALAAPAQSQAQVLAWPGERVTVTGCVLRTSFENRCLVIRDIRTGMSYQINAAMPPPNPQMRRVINLTGVVSPMFDTCMAGPVLQQIQWRYTPRFCPPLARSR